MRNTSDLWEALGSIGEEENCHVLTRLFTMYEHLLENNSKDTEALDFFRNLDIALTQTAECNLSRR
jgi:hypothetical protein